MKGPSVMKSTRQLRTSDEKQQKEKENTTESGEVRNEHKMVIETETTFDGQEIVSEEKEGNQEANGQETKDDKNDASVDKVGETAMKSMKPVIERHVFAQGVGRSARRLSARSPRGSARRGSRSPRGSPRRGSRSPRGSPRARSRSPRGSPRGRSRSPRGSVRGRSRSPRGSPRGRSTRRSPARAAENSPTESATVRQTDSVNQNSQQLNDEAKSNAENSDDSSRSRSRSRKVSKAVAAELANNSAIVHQDRDDALNRVVPVRPRRSRSTAGSTAGSEGEKNEEGMNGSQTLKLQSTPPSHNIDSGR